MAREVHPTEDDDPLVAVRGNRRWVHTVAPMTISASSTRLPIRPGGAYLIVGGTGGVGLSIARYLAVQHGAKLAMTSRTGPPSPDAQDQESRERLEMLEEIEEASPKLIHLRASASDPDEMHSVFEQVEKELGQLNGVIFTAAVVDTAGSIRRRSRAANNDVISAKVHGSMVLADLLKNRPLDFVVLSSSIASQLYHNRFGQVGYVTANAFSEAFAESGMLNADRVVTIAWDDWLDVGMSVKAAQDFSEQHGASVTLMDHVHSFSPEQGIATFERALATDESVIYVSTTRLDKRIEADRFVVNPFLEQAANVDLESEIPDSEGSLEDTVRDIWRSLIGVDDIGPEDDFFDLGGRFSPGCPDGDPAFPTRWV